VSHHITVETRKFRCGKCEAVFEAEILGNIQVEVWCLHIRLLRCSKCGADSHSLYLYFDESFIPEAK